MSDVTLDPAAFRIACPEFATKTDPEITAQWNIAILYVTTQNYGRITDTSRAYAIYLMMAHLFRLAANIASDPGGGGTPSITAAARIDKVLVTLSPPPTPDGLRYWLSLTPYGQQLLAFLSVRSIGGFYIGGSDERAAFRKAGGRF